MSELRYFKSLDGLRGIAIMLVVLYHSGSEIFSFGYAGVDVFFPLSGFLITRLIRGELENKQFSLKNFFLRRMRRLFPSLGIAVVVTTLFAWFILTPRDMKDFAQSLISIPTISSNVLFWIESDYFSQDSKMKPFIHFWSLAIEEQYYLVAALITIWLTMNSQSVFSALKKLRFFFIFICTLSLISFVLLFNEFPEASFFLTPFRIWELAAGSAFALRPCSLNLKRFQTEICAATSLLMMLFPIVLRDQIPHTFAHILPCCGTLIFISVCEKTTLISNFLSFKPLVLLGQISYALYIVHQPIFALTKHFTLNVLSLWVILLIIFISTILGFLLYQFIEQPIRKRKLLSDGVLVKIFLLFSSFCLIFGLFGHFADGVKERFSLPDEPKRWSLVCADENQIRGIAVFEKCLGQINRQNDENNMFVLGDSHAMQLVPALLPTAEKINYKLKYLNTGNRSHFPFSYFKELEEPDEFSKQLAARIMPGDIVIISFHAGRLNAKRDEHVNIEADDHLNIKTQNFLLNMSKLISEFEKKHRIRVVLVNDLPMLRHHNVERCRYEKSISKIRNSSCAISKQQHESTSIRQTKIFRELASSFKNTCVVELSPFFFKDSDSFDPFDQSLNYLYFDASHMTKSFALSLRDYLAKELTGVSSKKTQSESTQENFSRPQRFHTNCHGFHNQDTN